MNPEEKEKPSPAAPSESHFPPAPHEASPLKQIRTFQGDVAEALHTQNESIVSIQQHEVARRMEAKKEAPLPPVERPEVEAPIVRPLPVETPEEREEREVRTSGFKLLGGIIFLVLLGAGGGWYAYKGYRQKTFVPVVEIVPNRFLTTDSLINIDVVPLARETFIQNIQAERTTSRSGIEQIELKKGEGVNSPLMTTSAFLDFLQARAPGSLVRAFNPLFMMGLLSGNPRHTFLIIKLDSFENAFPGMLGWEKFLADDLLPLFAADAIVKNLPSDTVWKDITIQNKDARVLKDSTGTTVLLYSFFDNNRLLITDSEETLRTLITRLTSEKLSR